MATNGESVIYKDKKIPDYVTGDRVVSVDGTFGTVTKVMNGTPPLVRVLWSDGKANVWDADDPSIRPDDGRQIGSRIYITTELAVAAGKIAAAYVGNDSASIKIEYRDDEPEQHWHLIVDLIAAEVDHLVNDETGEVLNVSVKPVTTS